jgi:hypothetical protein
MDDRKIVDLSQRRADDRRQRRKAALSRFKPGIAVVAWAAFFAVAVVGFLMSGEANRFEKAPPAGVTE